MNRVLMFFRVLKCLLSVDSCFSRKNINPFHRVVVRSRLCILEYHKRKRIILFTNSSMFKYVIHFFLYTIPTYVNIISILKQKEKKYQLNA